MPDKNYESNFQTTKLNHGLAKFKSAIWSGQKDGCNKSIVSKAFGDDNLNRAFIKKGSATTLFGTISRFDKNGKAAFSLVEMLMALLVASLLLAALAPVMTKRFSENVNVSGSMGASNTKQKIYEIEFGSDECSDIKIDSTDGSEYCEGEFEVPRTFKGGYIKATVISAGGGGGVSPTAGYTEYTTAGSTNTFTVPSMTGNIEATLISGGAGGGAGGQARVNHTFVTNGNGNVTQNETNLLTVYSGGLLHWTPPAVLKGKYYLITACGGGGGGGGSSTYGGAGGGSGGYFVDRVSKITMPTNSTIEVRIGGGGGGGGGDNQAGKNGGTREGGGGGSGTNHAALVGGASSASDLGGAGGKCINDVDGYGGYGGDGGNTNGGSCIGCYGTDMVLGGNGPGGKGGNAPKQPALTENRASAGGGGAGGSFRGGGGGGATGGSGGGGGAATTISSVYPYDANTTAPGGGGGGGGGGGCGSNIHPAIGSGGGGGAGVGGGAGGDGGCGYGNGGKGGAGGVGTATGTGGAVSTVFGSNYCNGGNISQNGKSGALRIGYLSYGPGGSGGGGASIAPLRPVKVNGGSTLSIILGKGGTGGTPGQINSSGTIVAPVRGAYTGMSTYLKDSSGNNLLHAYGGDKWCPLSGDASGQIYTWGQGAGYGHPGGIYNGITSGNSPGSSNHLNVAGFSNSGGKSAGNGTTLGNITYGNGTIGGDGGTTTTPFTGTCTPGAGGTASSPNGKNATGYGCGGGGGYGLANGGSGSGGYARISWNMYWDTASNAYKMASLGAGGGGASGNVFTYSMQAKANQTIKIRIGKGGNGAYVSNNTLVNSKKGGDTSFGDINVRGGNGGYSVSINPSYNPSNAMNNTTNNPLINGKGGVVPGMYGDTSNTKICTFGNGSTIKDYTKDNKRCIKGNKGNDGINTTGGNGGNFIGYTLTIIDKEGKETKKEFKGEGGNGGILDTGDNSNGKDAMTENNYASGGGGSSIRDLGQVSSSSQSNITNNPTKGGNGSNGKIILEWWE